MTLRHSLLAVLTAVIWGFNFVVIQWGMVGVPPLLFVAVRFLVVAAPAVLLLAPRPPVALWKIAVVGTFLSLGQFAFLYVSIDAGMPAGLASLVLQSQVVLTVLAAAAVLRERPTRPQLLGVVLGSAGLVVVAAGRDGHVPLPALLLCLSAACSWAVGNVVVRALKVSGGLSLTIWSALVVPVPMLLLSLLVDGPHGVSAGLSAFGWKALVSTAYTAGLASFVGYGAWNSLLARYPSSQVVPWSCWCRRSGSSARGSASGRRRVRPSWPAAPSWSWGSWWRRAACAAATARLRSPSPPPRRCSP
jgi:O-acetylserine/cysteine efflux transporter